MEMVTRYTSETYPFFGAATEQFAASALGSRYKPGGRGPDIFDCLGLVICFYAAAEIDIPDPHSTEIEEIVTSGIFHHFRRVATPDYGDVAIFRAPSEDKEHVGVAYFGGILHAVDAPMGVVCVPAEKLRIREYYRNLSVTAP